MDSVFCELMCLFEVCEMDYICYRSTLLEIYAFLNKSWFPCSFTSKRAVSPNPYLDNPVNGYACPTGMALHYDDVPINGTVSTPAH